MDKLCFYFGAWGYPGHYFRGPMMNGRPIYPNDRVRVVCNGVVYGPERVCHFGDMIHIDANLAPMRNKRTGELCWGGQGATRDDRLRIRDGAEEYPQGQFLRHVLDNGFTAIQWWDRNQGDTRRACNSTILLWGEASTTDLIIASGKYFPTVLQNLQRAGVDLVEVPREGGDLIAYSNWSRREPNE